MKKFTSLQVNRLTGKRNCRNIFIFCTFAFLHFGFISSILAQDAPPATSDATTEVPKMWTNDALFQLGLNQSAFVNWAAGGENTYAGLGRIAANLNRKGKESLWENHLMLAYGASQQGKKFTKTEDVIEIGTRYGYHAAKHWNYTGIVTATTQFDKGYLPDNDTVATSSFLNPLKVVASIGMEYKSNNDDFDLLLSPIALDFTYVLDTIFGHRYSIDPGKHMTYGLGAYVNAAYKHQLMENVNLGTRMILFYDYITMMDEPSLRVDWNVIFNMKINSFLAMNIEMGLLYDPKVKFDVLENDVIVGQERRWQFKEVFMLNFTYKLGGKKA